MKNLYLLQTDKPSRLFKLAGDLFLEETFSVDPKRNLHIYITSEEKIKQGDLCIYPNGQVIKYLVELNTDWLKKIILTTDHSLKGVQQIDDEFLKWFVQNPTCEEVEVEKEYKNWYVSGILAPDMKLNYKIKTIK